MQSQVWFGVLHAVADIKSLKDIYFYSPKSHTSNACCLNQSVVTKQFDALRQDMRTNRLVSYKESPGCKCCTPAGSSGTSVLLY